MDQWTSAEIQQVSNVVLDPQDNTSHNDNMLKSEIIDITHNDIKYEARRSSASSSDIAGGSSLFKNLFFELPTKQRPAEKRKQHFSVEEGSPRKKGKTGKEVNVDSEGCDSDEEDTVFNYLTGTYEKVRNSVKSNVHEDLSAEGHSHHDDESSNTGISLDAPEVDLLLEQNDASHEDDRPSNAIDSLDASNENVVLENPSTSNNEIISVNTHKDNDDQSSHIYTNLNAPEEDSLLEQDNPSHDDARSSNAIVSLDVSNENVVLENPSTSNNEIISLNTNKENYITSGTIHIDSISKPNGNIQKENHVDSSLKSKKPVSTKSTSDPVEKRVANEISSLELNTLNWNCKTCGHNARTKQELISHVYNAHLKEDYEIKIKCKICNFECDTQNEMEKHELSHEGNATSSASSAVPISQSSAPGVSLPHHDIIPNSSDESLERGSQASGTETSQNSRDVLETSDSDEALPSYTKRKHVQCCLCNYKTNKLSKLRGHAGRHSGLKYYCEDHFWIEAMTTCPKCIFEKLMVNLPKYVLTCKICGYVTAHGHRSMRKHAGSVNCQRNVLKAMEKKQLAAKRSRTENNILNKSNSTENQGSEYSDKPAQDSVLTVEFSQNKRIALQIVSEVADNVASLENTDQNKGDGIENQSSQCSVEHAQHSVLTAELSPKKQIPVQIVSEVAQNIDSFEESDQNKGGGIENQSSQGSVQPAQHSVLTVESSQIIQIPLEIVSDVASLENTDQNKTGAIENQSFQCSVQPAQHSVLTVESSQNEQISLQILTEVAQNATSIENADQTKRGGLENQSSQCSVQLAHNSEINAEPSPNIETSLTNVSSIVHNVPASVQKHNVSNVNTSKKRKNSDNSDSESQIFDLDESDSSAEIDFPVSFKCFDCDKAIFKKNELRTHALSCHSESSFICDQHESKTRFYDCQKCVYELIFKNCQVTRSGCDDACDEDPNEVVTMGFDDDFDFDSSQIVTGVDAFDVDSRDVSILRAGTPKGRSPGKYVPKQFKYKEPKFSKKCYSDTDSDSDTSVDADSIEVRVTRARACKNRSLMKQSESKLTSKAVDENSNGTGSTDYLSSIEIEHAKPPTNSKIRMVAKCFDCEYTNERGLYNLRSHACRHLGSKYQCIEHWKVKLKDCLKCVYEVVLKKLHNEVIICPTCAYKTNDKYKMDRHRSGKIACDKWQKQTLPPEEMMCFECRYITTRKDLLKYHMVDHLDREFSCENHPEDKKEKCLRCIHKECLENARKEALSCEECGFKTVNKEVFKIHGCTIQMDDESTNEVVSEGICNGIITQESMEVEIDTTAKKYRCFDCDEFDTDTMDDLKQHANLHSSSHFQCNEHISDTIEECSKCIYQNVVNSLKNSAGKNTDVSTNKILTLVSSDISLVDSENTELRFESDSENTQSSDHLLHPQNESEDIGYQQVELSQAKCFDCKYSGEKGYTFRKHVSRHFGSKYQCLEHWKNNVIDCSKCYYEHVLQNLHMDLKVCKTCGYKTLTSGNFTRHLAKLNRCKRSQSGLRLLPSEVICFGCQYITTKETFLKYHMVEHLEREFSCKTHRTKNERPCEGCINEKCLKRAKKEALTCKKCGFKTIIKKVLELHECIPSSAAKSNDTCDPTEQDDCLVINKNNQAELAHTKHSLEKKDASLTGSESTKNNLVVESTNTRNNGHLTDEATEISSKCFDCGYSTGSDYRFKQHICRHIGSKYQCMEHCKGKLEGCLKCRYEVVLQKVCKTVKACKTCGFETTSNTKMRQHLSRKQPCEKWNSGRKLLPGEVICFACNYITTFKTLLKYHMVDHLNRAFSCKRHRIKKNRQCKRCINEKCLESAKKEALTCEKCSFKTVNIKVLEMHECTSSSVAKSKCILMDKNVDGEFDNSKNTLERSNVFSTEAGNTVTNPGTDSRYIEHSTDNNKFSENQTGIIAKCFDCKYSNSGKRFRFMKHVCRHMGSKYQCMEHWKDKLEYWCSKCYYECALKNLNKQVRVCETCRYRTIEKSKMDKHCASKDFCERRLNRKVLPGEIRCLECYYVTTRKKFLKYHMVDHLDLKFSCDVHRENKIKECEKCINEECLESAKKEAKICEKCKFKTVIQEIFERHECTAKSGSGSTEGTSKEVWVPEGQDSEVITIEDVEVGIEATAKTYRCFDCKEFATDTMDGLRKHANLHSRSEFQCDEHCAGPAAEDCAKCIYQKLLNNSETHNYGYSLQTIGLSLAESENDASNSENNNKTTENQQEAQDGSKNNEDKKTAVKAKCFDCKGSSAGKDCDFKTHVCRHIGSKYQCMEHWKNKVKHCSKCNYEEILKNLRKEVKSCKTCGCKAFDQISLTRHIEGLDTCKEWAGRILGPEEIRCLGCHYVTARKEFLKYHMVDHLDLKFSCDMHRENKNEKCEKCINEECLETAKKEAKICEKCKFKTVIKQIFKIHDCEGKMSVTFVNGSTEGTSEAICTPEDQDIDVITIEEDVEVGIEATAKKYSCFDCKEFATDTMDGLRKHANLHSQSKFQCDEHSSDPAAEDCAKCIYQKLVNKSGIRNKNSVDDEADGPVAENYRHARKNNNSNSRNNNNTIENEQESRGSKNNDDKKTEIKAKCFDCKNSSAGKDCDFKTHVSRHIGSKYQCMEHLKNKIKQCSKCHYEEVLKNLPKEVKSCKTCGYKAFDQISLTRHIEGLDTCKDWAGRILGPGEIRCLGCYYVTARKEFLKYHMVDHLDLKFSCDMHREIKNEKCEKCINEECLESAKKEAKICEKCKFKSVIKQIFKIHDCEGKMSVTFVNGSTERTSEAICTPEAQDSDVITIEDSVEVGSDTTAKKYSCFDCKEFATGTMDDLRKHAKFHSQSKFHCDEHCTGPAAEDCSKCIYQELVNKSEIQNKSNVGSEADVPVAENYRHSLKNNDSNSRSNKTTGNEQESQDGGENNDGKNTEVKDKCFDCKYYFAGKDCDFKKHVSRHIGSKYQCMDHWKNNVKHCSKCHYEEVLKNVSKEVKSCKTCGYKAFDQVSLTRHIEGKTCKKWAGRLLGAGEIRCLVCRYVTARKTFLKYHMVDHLDLKFSCDMHPENNHERCEKCINEECLESAKKEAKICEKCKFKTVIKQIFEMHECKAKIAATSTGSTKQDITNPEEQNSDVIIIEKRFEEGTDKIAGKLRCFDCNEFTTDTANELKNHAIRHYKTTFHCAEHCSNSAAGDCSKCIYQNVIKSMENRVFVCDKCQFKTDSEDAFSNHDCDVANDKDSDITSSKKGEYNAVPASGSSELLEPTLNVFKCFDCGVTKHTILCLKNHAEVHLGSTFRCETHYAQPYINCQKCVYEDIIKNIGNNTFTCKSCGFKAYSCLYLRNHEQSKVNCELYKEKLLSQGESLEVVQVKTFRCFDCGFSHERRDFLENHILVHARSTFQCENHNEYLEGCQQCLYRSLLDQGRNRFLRKCFHCNPPKTFCSPSSIKKHIMRIHQGSFYSCKRHNQRTEHCSRCAFEYLVMAANQNVFRIVCCDCKDERFASKATLKDHIKKFHLRSSFGCNIHPLSRKPDVCHMCLYEDLVQLCESEANSVEIVASRSKRGLSHYQCFDCDFKSRGRVAIATHIRKKHLESNFSCREHTLGDIDESTCSMCRYEHVLVTTKQDVVFRCSICNFEALNTNALSKHHKQKHAEVTSMNIARVRDASPKHPKEKHIKASSKNKARVSNVLRKKLTRYTCFDCVYFVTNSRKNLFRHVSRATHKSRTFKFTCRKHKLFDDACERCAFAKISDRVKRRKKSLKKP